MVSINVNPAFVINSSGFTTKTESEAKQKCSLGWNSNCYNSFGNLFDLESLFPLLAVIVYRRKHSMQSIIS